MFRKSHVAISQFRGQQIDKKGTSEESTSKFIQVLLILIQHGANGLNLLEAQHVVLVEPLLNPAAEAQAISRVHRIGQKNKTLIHRFIVSGCKIFFERHGVSRAHPFHHFLDLPLEHS